MSDVLNRFQSAVAQSGFAQPESIILAFEGGSVMHGASVGNDDHDYYAVYLEPPENKLGITPTEHHVWSTADNTRRNTKDDIDLVMYTLTKVARLLAKGNPTILHFLYVENALGANPYWDCIVRHRQHFLARTHLEKFVRYGIAQLDRLLGLKARKQFRPELIDAHGYDTKAAMHAVRLMYEALYLIRDGKMSFPNPNAAELIGIRQGKHTLEHVVAWFNDLRVECEAAVPHSPLAVEVNVVEVNRVVANTYLAYWQKKPELLRA
jgi:uncharacterized protein